MTLHGLTERQWLDLARRVSQGIAVDIDADAVELLGLWPQAQRIRSGMATHEDAAQISLAFWQQMDPGEVAA
ncbi:MAG: hypothetical protein ACOC0Q_09055 [Wenzhouxiangella sp.]